MQAAEHQLYTRPVERCGDERINDETSQRALQFTTAPIRNLFEVPAEPRSNKDSPELLEGKGKDVRPGGRVVLILLIDREGVLEWNLEVGGR